MINFSSQIAKKIESTCRRALYDFKMLRTKKIAVALSGGKDSITLLYMLKKISGKGFPSFEISAIHAHEKNQNISFLQNFCTNLNIQFIPITYQKKQDCYSCARERRKAIFYKLKNLNIKYIAFGHHREDNIQTLLLNLFHKGEFAHLMPKIKMHLYGITIIRPLIYTKETDIKKFIKTSNITTKNSFCPLAKTSKRKTAEKLIDLIEKDFKNVRSNLSKSAFLYGSQKARKNLFI